jgi:hypothetical protein
MVFTFGHSAFLPELEPEIVMNSIQLGVACHVSYESLSLLQEYVLEARSKRNDSPHHSRMPYQPGEPWNTDAHQHVTTVLFTS